MLRPQQRLAGSSYIEALLVIGMLSALLGLALSFGQRHVARLTSEQHRRGGAWKTAAQCRPQQLAARLAALAEHTDADRASALLRAALPGSSSGLSLTTAAGLDSGAIELPASACSSQRQHTWLTQLSDQVTP